MTLAAFRRPPLTLRLRSPLACALPPLRLRSSFLLPPSASAPFPPRLAVPSALRRFASVTVSVPSMGDSITEGTIVEWTAEVGSAVSADDVVALIETDKVTVDIKAETDGVIVEHFGNVDDTVEVGAPLYVLDTTAAAAVAAPSDPVVEPLAERPPAATVATRVPAIRFRGKAGWRAALVPSASVPEIADALAEVPEIADMPVPPMYGRPSVSDAEAEALLSGGASVGPALRSWSKGQAFAPGAWDARRITV